MKLLEEQKAAKQAFLDCREYGMTRENSRQDVGRDLKQLLVWHMRQWNGKHDTGVAHNRERYAEIERFQRIFAYPITRQRMINCLTELLNEGDKAAAMGLVTHGNAINVGGKIVRNPDDLDETKPFQRAYANITLLRQYVSRYPLLWLCVFVFRLWRLK